MKYRAELTDTFGGEPNYGWVRQKFFEAPSDASDALLVRRAKQALEMSDRHIKELWGETIVLRWPSLGIIAFIDYCEEDDV